MSILIVSPPPVGLKDALDRAAAGDEVIVQDGPRAFRISPIQTTSSNRRGRGSWKGAIDMRLFDDPLPDDLTGIISADDSQP